MIVGVFVFSEDQTVDKYMHCKPKYFSRQNITVFCSNQQYF